MRRGPFALLATALALSACGGSGEPASETHRVPEHGFSLSVPADWKTVKAGDALAAEEVEEFREANPEVASYLDLVSGPDSPIEFLALDPDAEDGFAANLNVVVFRLARSLTFDAWADAAAAEVARLPGRVGGVERKNESLPAGAAVRLAYRQEFELDGTRRTVATTQYGLVAGRRAYVLTLTTLPEREAEDRPVVEAAARSFRLDR